VLAGLNARISTAPGADAAKRDIKGSDFEPFGQDHSGKGRSGRHFNIRHFAATIAEKMTMFPHVRTKPRGAAVQGHLPEQTTLHQDAEAVVNGGKRDLGHPPADPLENFVCGRMIVAVSHHFENLASLPGKTVSARLQRFLKPFSKSSFINRTDTQSRITLRVPLSIRRCHQCHRFQGSKKHRGQK